MQNTKRVKKLRVYTGCPEENDPRNLELEVHQLSEGCGGPKSKIFNMSSAILPLLSFAWAHVQVNELQPPIWGLYLMDIR